jgi:hypothetical protein
MRFSSLHYSPLDNFHPLQDSSIDRPRISLLGTLRNSSYNRSSNNRLYIGFSRDFSPEITHKHDKITLHAISSYSKLSSMSCITVFSSRALTLVFLLLLLSCRFAIKINCIISYSNSFLFLPHVCLTHTSSLDSHFL